jgi:hypothetical protein
VSRKSIGQTSYRACLRLLDINTSHQHIFDTNAQKTNTVTLSNSVVLLMRRQKWHVSYSANEHKKKIQFLLHTARMVSKTHITCLSARQYHSLNSQYKRLWSAPNGSTHIIHQWRWNWNTETPHRSGLHTDFRGLRCVRIPLRVNVVQKHVDDASPTLGWLAPFWWDSGCCLVGTRWSFLGLMRDLKFWNQIIDLWIRISPRFWCPVDKTKSHFRDQPA